MSALEHRHLRSAIEFATLMAAEGNKRKPGFTFPSEFKKFFHAARIPNTALGPLRRAIEGDHVFRERLAAGALPELVDEIGRLWLQRPDGWQADAERLAVDATASSKVTSAGAQLKAAERRRIAAEQAAVRTRAELGERNDVVDMQATEIDTLRAELAKAEETLEEMRIELIDVRMDVRHARDRETAARTKAQATEQRLAEALDELAGNEQIDHEASATSEVTPIDHSEDIAAAATAARRLVEQLESLLPSEEPLVDRRDQAQRPVRRTPLVLPGGVIASSAEAAEFLARSDAQFLIDGYNVAKLGWPNRPLDRQRHALLDAVENLCRRFGTDCTVVFDGAEIIGAHASRRRLARVVYSPAGIIADDVIRDETRRLPTSRAVVVVTNDAEIVRDVRADGANVVPSNALIAIM